MWSAAFGFYGGHFVRGKAQQLPGQSPGAAALFFMRCICDGTSEKPSALLQTNVLKFFSDTLFSLYRAERTVYNKTEQMFYNLRGECADQEWGANCGADDETGDSCRQCKI